MRSVRILWGKRGPAPPLSLGDLGCDVGSALYKAGPTAVLANPHILQTSAAVARVVCWDMPSVGLLRVQ